MLQWYSWRSACAQYSTGCTGGTVQTFSNVFDHLCHENVSVDILVGQGRGNTAILLLASTKVLAGKTSGILRQQQTLRLRHAAREDRRGDEEDSRCKP
eukprot:922149-Rhodomonas_salina.1